MHIKKYFLNSIIVAAIAIIISSCCRSGTGGDATVVIFPLHNDKNVKNHVGYPDTVFVKIGAKDLPGLKGSDYDTYFVGKVGEDHVNCTGLKCGHYYVLAAGMDSTGPYRVLGWAPVIIKYKDRKSTVNVNVSVSN